jgi:hypothetical protein
MHFGPWFPLSEAIERALDVPGVVQMRAEAIFAYPRGQSAMVYYTCSPSTESLYGFMSRCGHEFLSHAETQGAHLIRYGEALRPQHELDRLLKSFETRFGSPPVGNLVIRF